MALNITFDGFCYLEDNSLSNSNVYYQGLFYPNGTASSSTTWNNVRIVENTGYYNINLGDGDWLTQEGTALSNAKVVIVFWKGSSTNRNDVCANMEQWGAFEITLDGSSTYTNPTQVKSNICPNLVWSLTDNGLVGVSYTATNNSYDVHNWDFMGTTMYHWRTRYGQNINIINNVDNTDYDWDDGNQDLDLSGAANASHSWLSAGDYDVQIVIEDDCGCTVTGTDTIRIKNNAPIPNIIMIPSDPDPNEVVSFQYTGTDPDDKIVWIDWTINDAGIYGNTPTTASGNRDDIVPHSAGQGTDWCGQSATSGAFTNPGDHLVSINVYWFDGFTTQVLNYSETFTQDRFTGPTVDFTQDPAEATLASGVRFINDSTSTSRVGLGLPDCTEYDWTWTDNGVPETESDKPFTYELEKTPTSTDCSVKLCASWSDGWDTNYTCTEKDVVFATTVTVTEEDCYYNLNVIGTSSNGTVTGYGWTVYSGTSISGSWTETWTSPIDIDQNNKKICFTAEGYYKIVGTVYGTGSPTSDDEILHITTVCPPSEAIYHIWNGTGILDIGGDWDHSGYGVETEGSKRSGTNGLDAVGFGKNDDIWFSAPGVASVEKDNYDFLVIWANIRSWEAGKDISVNLFSKTGPSDSVNLSNYINQEITNTWQKVQIPLTRFDTGDYLNKLRLRANGNISLWLDDIRFTMGDLIAVPICEPDPSAEQVGEKELRGKESKPAPRTKEYKVAPISSEPKSVELKPRIVHKRPFPPPRNI